MLSKAARFFQTPYGQKSGPASSTVLAMSAFNHGSEIFGELCDQRSAIAGVLDGLNRLVAGRDEVNDSLADGAKTCRLQDTALVHTAYSGEQ
jgi:hypothetical protein